MLQYKKSGLQFVATLSSIQRRLPQQSTESKNSRMVYAISYSSRILSGRRSAIGQDVDHASCSEIGLQPIQHKLSLVVAQLQDFVKGGATGGRLEFCSASMPFDDTCALSAHEWAQAKASTERQDRPATEKKCCTCADLTLGEVLLRNCRHFSPSNCNLFIALSDAHLTCSSEIGNEDRLPTLKLASVLI